MFIFHIYFWHFLGLPYGERSGKIAFCLFMSFLLGLMMPADFIKHFFVDCLPVYRLTFGFKFFDYRLNHLSLKFLLGRYALGPFAKPTKITVNSHYNLPG
jgi:hypothetical protein